MNKVNNLGKIKKRRERKDRQLRANERAIARKFVDDYMNSNKTFNFLKIIPAVLTAVTAGYISSRLTNVVNTFLIVAVVSFSSVTLIEVYRRTIASTVSVAIHLMPISLFEDTIEQVIGEISSDPPTLSSRAIKFLKRSYFGVIIAVFGGLTVLGSYIISVSTADNVKPVVINKTVLQQPVKKITDAEKQRLIDEAVDKSKSDTNSELEFLKNDTEVNINDRFKELVKLYEAQKLIQDQKTDELNALKTQSAAQQALINDLTKRIKSLEEAGTSTPPASTTQ